MLLLLTVKILKALKMHFLAFGPKGLETNSKRFTKLQDNKAQSSTQLNQTVSI